MALRTVYFGTPPFAVPPLQALIDSAVADVIAVISQPDRPAGRGRRLTPPPVKVLAEQHGIPVLQPAKLRGTGFAQQLAALHPDVAVVAAYGKILPRDVLEAPRLGCINIHASLLPRHRGAAPIQWALIEGDAETGVTIMRMDEGMDTGPIIAQERVEILEDDDQQSLSDMLSMTGARLMVEVLEEIARTGEIRSVPQSDALATHARLLTKDDGLIDWDRPARRVVDHIRGVTPWPGAQTANGARLFKVLQAEPIPADHPGAEPGDVVEVDARRGFVVAARDGFVLVQRVQPADRTPMTAADAANGGLVKRGDRLSPPAR